MKRNPVITAALIVLAVFGVTFGAIWWDHLATRSEQESKRQGELDVVLLSESFRKSRQNRPIDAEDIRHQIALWLSSAQAIARMDSRDARRLRAAQLAAEVKATCAELKNPALIRALEDMAPLLESAAARADTEGLRKVSDWAETYFGSIQ